MDSTKILILMPLGPGSNTKKQNANEMNRQHSPSEDANEKNTGTLCDTPQSIQTESATSTYLPTPRSGWGLET